MERTAQQLIDRRLNRMRLGQAVCEIFPLLSDPEMRVALVPLTEAEYDQCMEQVVKMEVPETISGNQFRDRELTKETLRRSIREPDDLTTQMFQTTEELSEALEVADINFLIDHYFEMVDRTSPSMEGMTDEEISDLKKVLVEMDWNALYGKQWYALKRFLLSLGREQLQGKLLGSFLTQPSIGTNDSDESTPENAEGNSQSQLAKSAESL